MKKTLSRSVIAALSAIMVMTAAVPSYAAVGMNMGAGLAPMDSASRTSAPSEKPSSAPSGKPSSAPSEKPSSAPSEKPSSAPSEKPSSEPSEKPSSAPEQPEQKPEAGFDSTAVQSAVSALEDDSVRSGVQEKLDAYISALNAEKEYLDSLGENAEIDSTYGSAVMAAREALEKALKEAGIDTEALLPEADKPDGTHASDDTNVPDGTHIPDGTHEPDGTHAPGSNTEAAKE